MDYKFLKNIGVAVTVEANKPLLLDDPKYVWVVEKGKIAVFSVPVVDGMASGVRRYLFEAQNSEILFGIESAGTTEKIGLLAVGLSYTSLIQIEKVALLPLLNTEARQWLSDKIHSWAVNLAGCTSLADEPQLQFDSNMVTIGNIAPRVLMLNEFHNLALQAELICRESQTQTAAARYYEKAEYEQLIMNNAIDKLLTVTGQDKKRSSFQATGIPLLDACRMVGDFLKISISAPPKYRELAKEDPLGEIAAASRIRVRKVILKGEWWKEDNGPLLAYLGEDNNPVALIPESPSKYILINPADKDSSYSVVDLQLAQRLQPYAFTFYRPFPEKVLNLRDILTFGMTSCWKHDFLYILIAGILGGLMGMSIPIATEILFDKVIPSGEKAQLLFVAFFLGASTLATAVFQLTRSLAMLRVEGKMDSSIQAAVWDRLLSLPAPFFRQFTAGELAMRAMGINQIRMILSGVTVTTILSSLFSVFNFGLLFYYNIKLALIATALILFTVAGNLVMGYWQIRYERQVLDISNKIVGLVLQIIEGISKFKVSGAESRAFYLWSSEFSEERILVFKKETIGNYMEVFNVVVSIIATMVIFYGMVSSSGIVLEAGKFLAFNTAFTTVMTSMIALANSLMAINIIIPLYERAKPILETLPEYDEAKVDPGELTGFIEVNHLNFRYKEDTPLILEDVSFQIKDGEYVGLVGPSGSGKSTLFRLLLGFEKPESGRIYYSGFDIEKVDIRSLRRQLGVVLQNGKLLPGDIFTNIVGSNPNLTLDDAWEAAKMAGLDSDIKDMPMGMHTVISEGAATFSGGQKQRLLIARAIVRKPKIIFFDEATSALDNRTQAIISQSLGELKATRIVIAHRLSTIVNCDRIIVLDRGKIVETGTYQELMDENGVFAEIAKRQLT